MSWTLWLPFYAAAWAISLSPGPGAVAVMAASLRHGPRRGDWTVIGLVLGFWTQLAVVAVGLGALLAASSVAFAVAKWAGVASLVWLGVRQWRAPAAPPVAGVAPSSAARMARALRTPSRVRATNRVFGSLFVGFGVVLALWRR